MYDFFLLILDPNSLGVDELMGSLVGLNNVLVVGDGPIQCMHVSVLTDAGCTQFRLALF